MTSLNWTKLIIVGWGFLLLASIVNYNLPASWWFEPQRPQVHDAKVGECPVMAFDRRINRAFHADWVVTIMRRSGDRWSTFRTVVGENDYRPDNDLPDDLDLCWWVWKERLFLPGGEYRVHTLWSIIPPGGKVREIRRTSNPFNIYRSFQKEATQ